MRKTYHYSCRECGYVIEIVERVRKPVDKGLVCNVCNKAAIITPVKHN